MEATEFLTSISFSQACWQVSCPIQHTAYFNKHTREAAAVYASCYQQGLQHHPTSQERQARCRTQFSQ